MINVNLLPHNLRPIKRTPIPYIASGVVVLIAIGVMTQMFLSAASVKNAKQALLDQHQQEFAKLEDVWRESDKLKALQQGLSDKIATIDEIVRGRMIWSEHLWNLTRVAPPNLWFSGFQEATKDFKERKTETDAKTGKQVTKDVTVPRPILKVSGYVIDTPELRADVGQFALAVEQNSEISQTFELKSPSIKDTTFENYAVKSFTCEFLIKSSGVAK